MTRNTEAYRKIRNTFRFLLGNLSDFDPARHAVPLDALTGADAFVVRRARSLARTVVEAYRDYECPPSTTGR